MRPRGENPAESATVGLSTRRPRIWHRTASTTAKAHMAPAEPLRARPRHAADVIDGSLVDFCQSDFDSFFCRFAVTRMSEAGPARTCRHGGPTPDAHSTMEFTMLLMETIPVMISETDAVKRRLAAGDEETDRADVCLQEIRFLLYFWSLPAHAALIERDSHMVPFSCAVDAAIDRNFELARVFVRTGAFVRQWAKQGRVGFLADYDNPTAWPAQQAEMLDCLRKTRTDQGIVLYLAKQVPCGCLQHYRAVKQAQALCKMEKCSGCEAQKPRTDLKRCSECKDVWYCSVECQRADWQSHRKLCKVYAQARRARNAAK